MRNKVARQAQLRPYGVFIIQGAQLPRLSNADTSAMINMDPTPPLGADRSAAAGSSPAEALASRPIG